MADRLELNEKQQAQANNVVHIWYEQSVLGDQSRKIIPKIISTGTGSIVSRSGKDCVIETDSHVITPQAKARVQLNEDAVPGENKNTSKLPNSVDLDLDTSTPVRSFAELANGKIIEARVTDNAPNFDRATLKFDIASGALACKPPINVISERLVAGEKFIELGFGPQGEKISAHPLILRGEKTAGEVKRLLSSQHIDVDEGIKKWDDNMSVLIFDGGVDAGDSGGPVLNRDGLKVARTLASGVAKIDGKYRYITYAAPIDLKSIQEVP